MHWTLTPRFYAANNYRRALPFRMGLLAIALLILGCLQAPPGLAQASDCTNTVPTTKRKSFAPKHPTFTLANPLNLGAKLPLTMLTLGDSAMWGNGLLDPHKYAYQVAQSIADGTARTVNLVVYAHSGATLSNQATAHYLRLRKSDHGVPPGDLNAGLPTTLQQEMCALKDPQSSDAEIVLLNGCINDVSAVAIGLPFPLSNFNAKEIADRSVQWCSKPMLDLLLSSKRDFPKATIIVANYWRIVSDKSSPFGIAIAKQPAQSSRQERAMQREWRLLLRAQIKVEKAIKQKDMQTHADTVAQRQATFQSWAENSRVFLDTSQGCFREAIASANLASQGSAPPDSNQPKPCPKGDPAPPQLSDSHTRVFLATVPDDPNFAYGAPQKHLWSVPIWPNPLDEVYRRRKPLCLTHFKNIDLLICPIDPTAHPNVLGAAAFGDRINQILAIAWKAPT